MTDRYQQLVTSPVGRRLASALGLPTPVPLRRHRPGDPLLDGTAFVGGGRGGRVEQVVRELLDEAGVSVRIGVPEEGGDQRYAALVYDATGADGLDGLDALHTFLHRTVARVRPSGRVVVLGPVPQAAEDVPTATTAQALEGLVRSVAKELRGGATANLVQVDPDAEAGIGSTLRFLLSARSAYVDGQVVRVGPRTVEEPGTDDPVAPLAGRVCVVTGAAQGIGAAIAATLARDGAHVVGVDLPGKGDALTEVVNRAGGTSLQLDITSAEAPGRLAGHLSERFGGVDVVVHNAGITRDRTIVGMEESGWRSVMEVNLAAQQRIDAALLDQAVLRRGGRLVGVSSVSGIAGNRGQTNYAASKAGVIGRVRALAPTLAGRGITINAVAPGFIETEMTDRMPLVVREVGRRLNSLGQGGRPVDVAETVAWLAAPASAWVNGQVVRVCGQALIGA